jgi:uncharacterized membrane protein (UPF0182 family)
VPGGQGNAGRNTTLAASGSPINPLYLTLQLPQEKNAEFTLQRSFTPRRKGGNLSSFIVARSDGNNYGKLVVYEIPQDASTPSPTQAASAIESDRFISSRFTPLDQQKSHVVRGDVQLIPIGDTILYVRPIWILGETANAFPRYSFTAAVVGDKAVLGYDVKDAITALVTGQRTQYEEDVVSGRATIAGGNVSGPTDSTTTTTVPTTPGTGTTPPGNATVEQLLQQAQSEFALADAALQDRKLDEYQRHIEAAKTLVAAARTKFVAGASTTTIPGSTTTTTNQP